MTTMTIRRLLTTAGALLALAIGGLLAGCADAQKNLPAATAGDAAIHPAGWNEPSSQNFHGRSIRADGWDLSTCQQCHSTQYTGGVSGSTCLTCHNQPTGPEDCRTCHGSAINAAPPRDTEGNTATSARGVGAHQIHLVGTKGQVVKCQECHIVPTALTSAGHIDSTQFAEVMFLDTLARKTSGGGTVVPNPSYSSTTLGCSSTYCHGTFKNGNTANVATWTDASAGACGTCHGDVTKGTVQEKALPKTAALGGTHPDWVSCSWCHNNIDAGASFTNVATHVNGTINFVSFNLPADCARCHGSGTNAAPPNDLDGNTARSNRGVGAHQPHLVTVGAKTVDCAECHTVPTTVYQTGHLDTQRPAEVMFGALAGLATTGVTPSPSFNPATLSCSSTYCHGTFRNGNTANAPTWTGAAGTGAACGSCHGDVSQPTLAQKALPKTAALGGTHPSYTQCQWCHTNVDASLAILDKTKHVDGQVGLFQLTSQADCSRCHGSGTNAAPPTDLSGNTVPTARGVGAHQVHLVTAANARTVKCAECHTVPTTLDYTGADGHLDATAMAEVLFQDTLARKTTDNGAIVPNPSYSSGTLSCANTYCHGTFKNGNLSTAPVWNDPSTAACGTCHGDPSAATVQEKALPRNTSNGGTHTTSTSCNFCHAAVIDASGNIIDRTKHINGKLNVFGTERDPWP